MEPGTDVNHGQRAHALLSASGASRWMVCTPSPRLEEGFQEKESAYAAEGTLAHEFAEIGVRLAIGEITHQHYNTIAETLRASEHFTDDMEDEVQKHIDYVVQQLTAARLQTPDASISIEEKIDLTMYIEDGFGTNDVVIVADGVLEVIDLKYGKGVRVSAEDNPQLKLYGLGALFANEILYDIHTVRVSVTQPRMDSISSWEISAEDLRAWGQDEVVPKAKMAYAGEGEQVPGSHCRFCKAKARCKALANEMLEVAKLEFADPQLLTDAELIEAYKKAPAVADWLNGVGEYLLAEALKGRKWPEYKLVEGRSNRVFTDEAAIREKLETEKYDPKEFLSQPKLLGIGAIEKLVGKKNFDPLLGAFVAKPEGKPSLVPESDKRPEFKVATAQEDFAD